MQQLYSLNQISELVRVGVLKIPTDNISLPKIDLTKSDFLNTIFLSQISEWIGQGMKVKICSQQKCKDCGLVFKEDNKFYCFKHDRWARRVFVSITGLTNYRDGRERIFTDKDNIPLSIEAGIKLKDDIVESIKNKTFNIKRYLPRSRQVFLFANYKKDYLKKMEWRTTLDPKDQGWMSKGHFSGIQTAFTNYLYYFDDYDIQKILTPSIQDWVDYLDRWIVKDKSTNKVIKKLHSKEAAQKYSKNKSDFIIERKPVSTDYKRKLIGYLAHILNWAKSRGDLTTVPKMPKIEFQRKKKKGLMNDAQLEILKCIPDEDKLIFEYLIETGRRLNEARAAKVRDLNFKERIYRIGGAFDKESYKPFPKVKDHAEEEYPITDNLFSILQKALAKRHYSPDDFVFINRIGKHYTDSRLRKIFNRARKKAGYDSITLNCFGRHSKGLQLKMAGASDEEIADILGNTPEIVRQTYTHVEAGRKAKILSLLDRQKGRSLPPTAKSFFAK